MIDADDSDTSSVDSNDSNLLVNNLVSSLVSNSVNKDVIDGMIIISKTPPGDKKGIIKVL